MRIIGIDPGSRKTGVGIIDYHVRERKFSLVHAKVLRLDLENDLAQRLAELASRLGEILELFQPEKAVLEDVFAGEHARSALILGQARGALLTTLGLQEMPVFSLAPRRVKQSLTGAGQASKQQVGEMVKNLLSLDKKPAEDAADALGVAMAYVLAPQASVKRTSSKKKRQGFLELAQKQGLV
ncbi:MAG: crossover junction endodeoxyribonuclease RuvC [Deltaproteobacteria bacterium]|nr:crossover junction endodeoxyribonuclease RuvC [Deltaproteobacteria bacterium]